MNFHFLFLSGTSMCPCSLYKNRFVSYQDWKQDCLKLYRRNWKSTKTHKYGERSASKLTKYSISAWEDDHEKQHVHEENNSDQDFGLMDISELQVLSPIQNSDEDSESENGSSTLENDSLLSSVPQTACLPATSQLYRGCSKEKIKVLQGLEMMSAFAIELEPSVKRKGAKRCRKSLKRTKKTLKRLKLDLQHPILNVV